VRWTLAWGPLVLVLACGASHRSSGDAAQGATNDNAGSGASTSMTGGSGGAPAGGRSNASGGSAAGSGVGGVAGTRAAGSGGAPRAGSGGDTASGGMSSGGTSSGGLAGTLGAAGAVDGRWRVTELRGTDEYPQPTFYAISGDGTYVTGTLTGVTGQVGARWQDDVPTVLETPADWTYVYSVAITEDGSKVAGYATGLEYSYAFTWDENGAHQLPGLDPPPDFGPNSSAVAISGDGHVVVGRTTGADGTASPVRWTEDTLEILTSPANFVNVVAKAVNRDGSLVVGAGQGGLTTSGLRWTEAGAESYGMDSVTVNDVSADGRFIVGSEATVDVNTGARPTRAVRYGPSGTEYLPDPDGRGWNCGATAVSADGSVLLGTCSEPIGNVVHPYAFLFNPERGSVPLDSVLRAVGVDISGYSMFTALDLSSDGTTLLAVRAGNPQSGELASVGLRIRIAGAFP
jgi:uncharacterized membrane protein